MNKNSHTVAVTDI